MKHLIEHSCNGIPVYVNLIGSAAAKNIARQPHLLTLARGALHDSTLNTPHIDLECRMGCTVGYNFVIAVPEEDSVFYAQLVRDPVYTRFTKKGEPIATGYLTMILELDENGSAYDLHDIWAGRYRPPKPGSDLATEDSLVYWKKHAVIFQDHSIQANTLTKTCPY